MLEVRVPAMRGKMGSRTYYSCLMPMQGVPQFIVDRQLAHFDKVDPAYGAGVRKAIASQGQDDEQASLTTSHSAAAAE